MTITRHFVLAAGGTGGHMMPAHALGAELVARGHQVALVTDARGAKIPGLFEDIETYILPAGRIVTSLSVALLAGLVVLRLWFRRQRTAS